MSISDVQLLLVRLSIIRFAPISPHPDVRSARAPFGVSPDHRIATCISSVINLTWSDPLHIVWISAQRWDRFFPCFTAGAPGQPRCAVVLSRRSKPGFESTQAGLHRCRVFTDRRHRYTSCSEVSCDRAIRASIASEDRVISKDSRGAGCEAPSFQPFPHGFGLLLIGEH